ncbi:MAG: hypothetical protein HYV90_05880 [Candidatus Woesebacteria bacterium]|nr:MAG: hypothetical protein HYV90_05880 [Candidatus Woesebacteria bacterium]
MFKSAVARYWIIPVLVLLLVGCAAPTYQKVVTTYRVDLSNCSTASRGISENGSIRVWVYTNAEPQISTDGNGGVSIVLNDYYWTTDSSDLFDIVAKGPQKDKTIVMTAAVDCGASYSSGEYPILVEK